MPNYLIIYREIYLNNLAFVQRLWNAAIGYVPKAVLGLELLSIQTHNQASTHSDECPESSSLPTHYRSGSATVYTSPPEATQLAKRFSLKPMVCITLLLVLLVVFGLQYLDCPWSGFAYSLDRQLAKREQDSQQQGVAGYYTTNTIFGTYHICL